MTSPPSGRSGIGTDSPFSPWRIFAVTLGLLFLVLLVSIQLLQENCSQSKLWKFTAVTLGIFCLALLTTAGFLAAQVIQQQEVSPSPLPKLSSNTIIVDETGCDRGPCPKHWIGFRNSCYLFSNNRKDWRDSKIACATLNSSLLWLDNREELDFLGMFSYSAWTGLFHNGPRSSWQWEDGTAFSIHGITFFKKQSRGNCVYQKTWYLYQDNCEALNWFICKQRTH
ncbi:natural killer cells antigen CD94-like isoform X3 [Ornithorhynchus anatinus]|uniref:natural killer cells antigen CD94-like isoform X3 n=1 Tax=Ornithorhynchus anatinus TaxID=9258 RepID=UPI0010A78157|nr:natural killer cells antigen CD94-like isoform X3 [Ornithorhynchus anatinus]